MPDRWILLSALALVACANPPEPMPEPASIARKQVAVSLARAPYKPDSGSLAIRCASLIDGVSTAPLRDVTILVRNGRIVELGSGLQVPAGMPVLNLHEHTCLPGLIDMHTHLNERPEDTADLGIFYQRTRDEAAVLAAKHAHATLLAGFTAVRNLGSYIAWADRDLRDAINRGEVAGPRMQVTGYYLTIPGGGGDVLAPGVAEKDIPLHLREGVSRGADEFRRNAERAIDGGADVLKVIASGAVLAYGGVPGSPEMTPAELAAVVSVARARERLVAAHAHGAQSIVEAITAGATTIEHASLIDEAGIQLARAKQVALAMDVYNGDYIDTEGRRQNWPEEFLRKNLETTEAQRQSFTRAHASGVPIVYATDAGVFPHGLNARQFPIMVERGMTPMQAIQSATSLAARYMGWEGRAGSLQRGMFGDLVAVKGDPLEDIARLQQVEVVIKGGLVFRLPGEISAFDGKRVERAVHAAHHQHPVRERGACEEPVHPCACGLGTRPSPCELAAGRVDRR
jgi:imidazolonepropionase-like amidohydrolase